MYINGWTRESVMKQIKASNFSEDFEGIFAPVIYASFQMPGEMPIVSPMLQQFQEFHDNYISEDNSAKTFFDDIENKLIELEKEWEDE